LEPGAAAGDGSNTATEQRLGACAPNRSRAVFFARRPFCPIKECFRDPRSRNGGLRTAVLIESATGKAPFLEASDRKFGKISASNVDEIEIAYILVVPFLC
jgi:hypothetical protein